MLNFHFSKFCTDLIFRIYCQMRFYVLRHKWKIVVKLSRTTKWPSLKLCTALWRRLARGCFAHSSEHVALKPGNEASWYSLCRLRDMKIRDYQTLCLPSMPERRDNLITCTVKRFVKQPTMRSTIPSTFLKPWFSRNTSRAYARIHVHTRKLLTKFPKQLIDFLLTRARVILGNVQRILIIVSEIDWKQHIISIIFTDN